MLAQANERHLARDLREAFRHLREQVPVAEIARLIRHGHLAGVADAAGLGHFGEVLKEPFQRLGEVWDKAADIGAGRINADFRRAGKRMHYRPRIHKAYDPDEPRDERGRWEGGGSRYKEYAAVNEWLRGDRSAAAGSERENKAVIAEMDKLIADNPLTHPITVYRGFGDVSPRSLMNAKGELRDKAYMSTSTSIEVARALSGGGYVARITVPAGVGAFEFKNDLDEHGIVLARGTTLIPKGIDHRNRILYFAVRALRKAYNLAKAIGDGFDFDLLDEDTQDALREAQDELIAQLDATARDVIESAITNGINAGDTPEEIANAIRDTISLTDRQAQAVTNYRLLLEDLDSGALNRALRNIEYDAAVEDAIDSGEFLSAEAIDRMVEDYADNFLDYRADTIARTESLRAANAGLRDGYRQAADRGVFPAEAVRRYWEIATDERVCPVCQSVAERNPDGVALEDDFESEDGPQDDPPIHPRCRCTVRYETNLDMLPDEQDTEDEDQAA